MPNEATKSLVRGTSIVSSLTLLSRILGFIRDLVFARLFGSGLIADAFFVAFRIPNLLRSFVAEGALTSAFVPIFSSELQKGSEHARNTFKMVFGLLITLTITLSAVGILAAPWITSLVAPGFGNSTEKALLCTKLMRIMFPYIICVSLVAMVNGALNTLRIFGMGAAAQITMNIALICGALLAGAYSGTTAANLLAVTVLVGGILEVLIQLPVLRKVNLELKPVFNFSDPIIKELLRLMAPAIIGAGVYQLGILLNTLLASLLREGSVSCLFYADRLAQIPIGVFSIALASVLLPTLSRLEAEENSTEFASNLLNALRYTGFFIFPVACGLFYFAEPLVELFFERGAFTHSATLRTAQALRAFCIGLWGISCYSMMTRAFLAKKDTVTPTVIGAITLLLNFIFSFHLMGQLKSSQAGMIGEILVTLQNLLTAYTPTYNLEHAGLALASSLSTTISFFIYALLLKGKDVRMRWQTLGVSTLKSLTAALGMIACLYIAISASLQPFWQLAIGMPLGVASYLLLTYMLRCAEFKELLKLILGRIKVHH